MLAKALHWRHKRQSIKNRLLVEVVEVELVSPEEGHRRVTQLKRVMTKEKVTRRARQISQLPV